MPKCCFTYLPKNEVLGKPSLVLTMNVMDNSPIDVTVVGRLVKERMVIAL